jgi:hypothetical protein
MRNGGDGVSKTPKWLRTLAIILVLVVVAVGVLFAGYLTRGFQHTIASNCELDDSFGLVYAVYTVGPGHPVTASSSFGSPIQSSYVVSRSGTTITIRSAASDQVVCQFVKGG